MSRKIIIFNPTAKVYIIKFVCSYIKTIFRVYIMILFLFIFKYTPKSGKVQQRYIHFAGSPNEIKKEGFKIKNEYGLKDNELILGVADAGSYSAAVRSKSGKVTNRLLNTTNSGYFNPNSFTGAGAVLLDPKLGEQE